MDAKRLTEEFEPTVAVGLAETREDGIVDREDDFGLGIFDVFSGVGNLGPRGRNRNTENLGVLNRWTIKRITGVNENVVYDYAEIVARDLVF